MKNLKSALGVVARDRDLMREASSNPGKGGK